jgi:hypothetical protein
LGLNSGFSGFFRLSEGAIKFFIHKYSVLLKKYKKLHVDIAYLKSNKTNPLETEASI